MREVEMRLADWHKLYKAVQIADTRLQAGKDGPEREALVQAVRQLRKQADEALDSVNQALLSRRPPSSPIMSASRSGRTPAAPG